MSDFSDKLVALFQEYGLDLVWEKDSSRFQTVLGIAERSFPLFINLSDPQAKIEILAFFPFPLNKAQVVDTARLLHLLNKELAYPGLGLDEENELVFFRAITLWHPENVRFLLQEIQQVCQNYVDVIEAISLKRIGFDDLMLQAQHLISRKTNSD